MSKTHQKHPKIKRPQTGHFGRNEISILGTPCTEIKSLAKTISENLSEKYRIAYIDADHKSTDDSSNLEGSFLNYGNKVHYTDKIDFHRFDFKQKPDDFQIKTFFNGKDLVLVNGNHFKAANQIVVIDSRKPLEKKLDKLTNVELFLLQNEATEIPDYIKDHIPDYDQVPVLKFDDSPAICNFIEKKMVSSKPKIKGLVLAGGRSTRMQKDKTLIEYHGKSQRDHMYDLLDELTDSAFYSIREDQEAEFSSSICVKDSFVGLGPYGAILSAMMKDPDSAWLVTASDQPFLTKEVLNQLIIRRNPSKVATAFYNPETDFPEPLITLWEPRAYSIMLQYLSLGYSCPRKVLINSDIEMLHLEDASVLGNVNTPEEYKEAIKSL